MHPLWQLLPAVTCALFAGAAVQTLYDDLYRNRAWTTASEIARCVFLAVVTVAATLTSLAQPIAWAMEAAR